MRPIRSVRAASAASFESLGTLLSSHGPVTRVTLAALSFAFVVALSQQTVPVIKAGPEPAPVVPESLLPQNVGVGIASDASISIPFDVPMDAASVEASLQLVPTQRFALSWNKDRTELSVEPDERWRTDERYLVVVARSALQADGQPLSGAVRYSFTTQTAPAVSDFQVSLTDGAQVASATSATAGDAPTRPAKPAGTHAPTETARDVSATSRIVISFNRPMDEADVLERFAIAPEVAGDLAWEGGELVFEPSARLAAGSRYTVSLAGVHDRAGNVLGGESNFSFIVQPGGQLITTSPKLGASDVEPSTVAMWFSQPMDVDATNAAFGLTDTTTGALVGGLLNWNAASTQLTYTPDVPFAGGRTFEVAIGSGGRDAFGNPVTASWKFTTKAAPVVIAPRAVAPTTTRSAPAPAPIVPPAAPATSLAGYALNQVNAARAAYGFAPVGLDAAVSAVASAHAWDQATNGYFSHTSLDGRTREDRLRAGGVSFGWSGENQCYHVGMSEQATLDWCHAQFMAEPYPGHWNHIANILSPNARRMGVGIATVGGRTVITWNFVD